MKHILITGMAVADFVFSVASMPRKSEKYLAQDAWVSSGGNAANAAVAAMRLGATATLAARLGQDPVGDIVVSALDAHGVDTRLVRRFENGRSSFSSIYIDDNGERQIMNFPGAGMGNDCDWLQTGELFDAVLADNRWPAMARRAFDIAKKAGKPAILDAEAPFDPACARGATHVAFSAQGFAHFTGSNNIPGLLLQAASRLGCRIAVTDGQNGTWHLEDGKAINTPAFRVEVRDSLGAGDTWHAAFAIMIAEGRSEAEAVRFANAAGALKCTRTGGVGGAPARKEVEEFMKEAELCN